MKTKKIIFPENLVALELIPTAGRYISRDQFQLHITSKRDLARSRRYWRARRRADSAHKIEQHEAKRRRREVLAEKVFSRNEHIRRGSFPDFRPPY